jgi:hypothetical protein
MDVLINVEVNMANNRMYLLHKQSGAAVYLGKRFGGGWDDVPDDLAERIRLLFRYVENSPGNSKDDFAVAMEVGANQPHVIDDWQIIGREGTDKIVFLELGKYVELGDEPPF